MKWNIKNLARPPPLVIDRPKRRAPDARRPPSTALVSPGRI